MNVSYYDCVGLLVQANRLDGESYDTRSMAIYVHLGEVRIVVDYKFYVPSPHVRGNS